MRKRILCLCLSMMVFACGCGDRNASPNHTATITTTATEYPTTTQSDVASSATTTTTTTAQSTTHSSAVSIPISSDSNTTHTTTQSSITTTASTTVSTVSTTQPTEPSADTVTFKATVRDQSSKQPISGITVTVYTDEGTVPAGSGVTGKDGVARVNLTKSTSYRVALSNLPQGYEANDIYRYSTNTVNINIGKAAVQNELDHSEAQYDVGKTMTNFTLTDTDGNTYRLSELLKENQLIILDFWFATCEPCKLEFPYFEAATQQYGDSITLLAVNPFDSNKTITALRNQLNSHPDTAITFPMLSDTCNLSAGFDVTSYPTTVFIDSNGCIVDIHIGAYPSEAAFFAAIQRYLYE